MTSASVRNLRDRHGEPIAITGMACIFPGAGNLQQYWHNIQSGVCALGQVPESRWDPLFYDPSSTDPDRFYCRKGGFVDDYVDFNPLDYGIMPKAAESADPDQLLSLRVGVEALRDAGLWDRAFNREKTGIIIGRGNYLSAGTLRLEQHVRTIQQTLQTLQDLIPDIRQDQLEAVKSQIKQQLSHYGPDTAVGLIPNLVASRLANRLDLKGPAYTVDAACASALLAVEQSCQLLRRGDTDVMLTGGLHFTHDLTFWATFCQLGALSRSECIRPLSAHADGILAGEGIGMLVLRRLSDAVRDGDRIYALIQGVASASDGKSSSLLAPAVEGQLLALQRAWQQTGLAPENIGLLEAHGTGTPAGDNAELETLASFFGSGGNGDKAGIGSVKSMIGHTMPAAGAAGLIKAAMSVYHGVRPVTLEAENPNPLVAKTRFRLLTATETWNQSREQRIAAVNAFGFGGINAHAVISGFRESVGETLKTVSPLPAIVRIAANSQQELLQRLASRDWQGDDTRYKPGDRPWRLVVIEPTEKRLSMAATIVSKGVPWHGRNQIFFSSAGLLDKGKIAFLFPGVDSTFNPRLDDVCKQFDLPLPAFCEKLDPARELLKVGLGLTGVNKVLYQVLRRLDIVPDAMAGHSIGEWSAMAASGCLSQQLIDEVNAKMDPESLAVPDVIFLAVANGVDAVAGLYEDLDDVHLSHDNCPHQIIFCGRAAGIETLSARLREKSLLFQRLPIVSGFHSPLLAEYARPFTDFFTSIALDEPSVPLWSANTAAPFPSSPEEKQRVVVDHLVQTVRFRELIDTLYARGFRAFVQVGVGSLPGFVDDTLKSRPHLSLASNIEKRSGLEQLSHVLAGLWVEGYQGDFAALGLAPTAQTTLTSEPSAGTIRLQLGVPLIRLSTPLQIDSTTTAENAIDADLANHSNDPIAQLFRQTLDGIQLASQDVQSLWVEHTARTQGGSTYPQIQRVNMRLDVANNIPWVMDHAFYPQRENWPVIADKHPVIPLTMEISLMREAAQRTLSELRVVGFRQVRAFNWLIVDKPVDITIVVEQTGPGSGRVSIEGFAEAELILAHQFPAPPDDRQEALQAPRPTQVNADQLYSDNWMFHGPAYQSITELGPIGSNGIDGALRVSSGEGALLDNMGQLAGYWVMEQETDCLAMPIGIEEILFFAPDPKPGEELHCEVRIDSLGPDHCNSRLRLSDSNGRSLVQINGWQTRRYSMDKRFWVHSKQVQKYLLSETTPEGYVLFADRYGAAITRDYLAKRYLNQPETQQYNQITPRRKRQWLNGRVAVKDAIRHYLWEQQGHFDFWPKEILIENDAEGKPVASAHISHTYQHNLHVSLAHKDHLSVAIAGDKPVGIDIEVIEPRSDVLIDAALTESESRHLRTATLAFDAEELLTRIWAAKEAVAKQRGTGLQGRPKDFVVTEITDDALLVNDQWVGCTRFENYIICWTQ